MCLIKGVFKDSCFNYFPAISLRRAFLLEPFRVKEIMCYFSTWSSFRGNVYRVKVIPELHLFTNIGLISRRFPYTYGSRIWIATRISSLFFNKCAEVPENLTFLVNLRQSSVALIFQKFKILMITDLVIIQQNSESLKIISTKGSFLFHYRIKYISGKSEY